MKIQTKSLIATGFTTSIDMPIPVPPEEFLVYYTITENKNNRVTLDSRDGCIHLDRESLSTYLTKIGEVTYTDTSVIEKIPIYATGVGTTITETSPGTDVMFVPADDTKYPFKPKIPNNYEVALSKEINKEVSYYIDINNRWQNIQDVVFSSSSLPSECPVKYGCYGDAKAFNIPLSIKTELLDADINKIQEVIVTGKDSTLDAYYTQK